MFEITHEDGDARTGILKTKSGTFETPFFMPVAAKATSKFIDAEDFKNTNTKTIISNAFVLYLTPGLKIIEQSGGIHNMMKFKGNIFTDSGGFQMYSQSFLLNTNKDGVQFSDPVNGGKVFCTPEKDMDIQLTIDSDVAMCLDDMPKFGASKNRIMESIKKTTHWAERCKAHHDKHNESGQLLFGIAQGGVYPDLRKLAAQKLTQTEFDGYAFGGLALGEPIPEMNKALKAAVTYLPKNKPRYLMGVGVPDQILNSISMGTDCWDSTFPTMNARHNALFTKNGRIDMMKKKYKEDMNPIDEGCDCPVCKKFSKAYLQHLAKTNEPNAKRYFSIHNIRFMSKLLEDARTAIKEQRFKEFKNEFISSWVKKSKN